MAFGELDRDYEGQLLLESGTRNAAVYKLSDTARQADFSFSTPTSVAWQVRLNSLVLAYTFEEFCVFILRLEPLLTANSNITNIGYTKCLNLKKICRQFTFNM